MKFFLYPDQPAVRCVAVLAMTQGESLYGVRTRYRIEFQLGLEEPVSWVFDDAFERGAAWDALIGGATTVRVPSASRRDPFAAYARHLPTCDAASRGPCVVASVPS